MRRIPLLTLALVLAAACSGPGESGSNDSVYAEPAVRLTRLIAGDLAIEVSGETISGRTTVRVYPEHVPANDPTFPSVAGEVLREDGSVRFTPKYPLEPGGRYQVFASDDPASPGRSHDPDCVHWIEVPAKAATEATRVVTVHPSGGELPANQLKLYIDFSAPMNTSAPYDYIRLVDEATGRAEEAVFHQMRGGLWDAAGRRLTVIFDPGRIKRGLANHEAMGLPLTEGRTYRLEISGEWTDASGQPLAAGYAKSFVVTPADRRRPSVSVWSVQTPGVGTLDPVRLDFGEPMDAALLGRAFKLLGPDGELVPIEVSPGPGEESCELSPGRVWAPGRYRIEVDQRLEDLAGNNFERLFDADRRADARTTDSSARAKTWLAFDLPGANDHRNHESAS